MKTNIYLDNASTTIPDPKVVEYVIQILKENPLNASSYHKLGTMGSKYIEKSREIIAKKINVSPDDIYFTSGGTESNNIAIKSIACANNHKGNHIITSVVEHPSIYNICKFLEKNGFKVSYIDVNSEGLIDPQDIEKAITKDTILVSIMHANNETGVLQPIEDIGKICNEHGVYFHTDACQTFTKSPIDAEKMHLDIISINSHKIHGIQGCGAIYIKNNIKITPLLHGGGQEKNIRPGTYNIHGISAFGKAVEISKNKDIIYMTDLRDYFIKEIENNIPDAFLNGSRKIRLCNIINFAFKDINAKSLLHKLENRGIFASSGAACNSKSLTPGRSLLAIGLTREEALSSIRFSISKYNTPKEIDYTVQILKENINLLRISQ